MVDALERLILTAIPHPRSPKECVSCFLSLSNGRLYQHFAFHYRSKNKISYYLYYFLLAASSPLFLVISNSPLRSFRHPIRSQRLLLIGELFSCCDLPGLILVLGQGQIHTLHVAYSAHISGLCISLCSPHYFITYWASSYRYST